eukprot:jgi/Mesvir1/23477/Mv22326-RA.1
MATALQRELWAGAVPIKVSLHVTEITSLPPPSPLYLIAPRLSYLPSLVSRIREHFDGALPLAGSDAPWFEFQSVPLKWHIPVGVLFDIFSNDARLPWELTIHFRCAYPSDQLPACDVSSNNGDVRWNYMNQLKEATYLACGSAKPVMSLSKKEQEDLWESVLRTQLDEYLTASSKLRRATGTSSRPTSASAPSSAASPSLDAPSLDHLSVSGRDSAAVRVYIRRGNATLEGALQGPGRGGPLQQWHERVSCVTKGYPLVAKGEPSGAVTLQDVVCDVLTPPGMRMDGTGASGSSDAGVVDAAEAPSMATSPPQTAVADQGKRVPGCVKIHGIEPPLSAPLGWLRDNLSSPDHFLHVCVFLD